MAELPLEDQQIAFPVPKRRPITNKIRTLRYPVTGWKHAVTRLLRATRTAFAACLGQVAIKAKRVSLLAIDESVNRFLADTDQADPISQKSASNLLR